MGSRRRHSIRLQTYARAALGTLVLVSAFACRPTDPICESPDSDSSNDVRNAARGEANGALNPNLHPNLSSAVATADPRLKERQPLAILSSASSVGNQRIALLLVPGSQDSSCDQAEKCEPSDYVLRRLPLDLEHGNNGDGDDDDSNGGDDGSAGDEGGAGDDDGSDASAADDGDDNSDSGAAGGDYIPFGDDGGQGPGDVGNNGSAATKNKRPDSLHFSGSGEWLVYGHDGHLHSRRLRKNNHWLDPDSPDATDSEHAFDTVTDLFGTLRSGDWVIVGAEVYGQGEVAAIDVGDSARPSQLFPNPGGMPLRPVALGHQIVIAENPTGESENGKSIETVLYMLRVEPVPNRERTGGGEPADVDDDNEWVERDYVRILRARAGFSHVEVVSQYDPTVGQEVDRYIVVTTGAAHSPDSETRVFRLPSATDTAAESLEAADLVDESTAPILGRIRSLRVLDRDDGVAVPGLSALEPGGENMAFVNDSGAVALYNFADEQSCLLQLAGNDFVHTLAGFSQSGLLFSETLEKSQDDPLSGGYAPRQILVHRRGDASSKPLTPDNQNNLRLLAVPSVESGGVPWALALDTSKNGTPAVVHTGDDDESRPTASQHLLDGSTRASVLGSGDNRLELLVIEESSSNNRKPGDKSETVRLRAIIGDSIKSQANTTTPGIYEHDGSPTNLADELSYPDDDPVCIASGASKWAYPCGSYAPHGAHPTAWR